MRQDPEMSREMGRKKGAHSQVLEKSGERNERGDGSGVGVDVDVDVDIEVGVGRDGGFFGGVIMIN